MGKDIIEKNILEEYNIIKNCECYNTKDRSFNKYFGDVCVRIIKKYLFKSFNGRYDISEPNSYIECCSTEFDLLVIKRDRKPKINTNCYEVDDVVCVLEIKANGVFNKENDPKKILIDFDKAEKLGVKKCAYLTFAEVITTKRKNSINYLKKTKDVLENKYGVFCLSDSRNGSICEGEWDKLIKFID